MQSTKKFMRSLAGFAPAALVIFSILSFIALIVFKVTFYNEFFLQKFATGTIWLAILLAVIIEGSRFGFLLSSSLDALEKDWKGFVIGLVASILLLVYEFFIAEKIGQTWDGVHADYANFFRFLAGLGFVIELRLCLLMWGADESEVEAETIVKEEKPKKATRPRAKRKSPRKRKRPNGVKIEDAEIVE